MGWPVAPWPFVEIRWLDCCGGKTWASEDELPKPVKVTTRGWLVKETDEYVVVAGTWHPDNDEVGKFTFGDTSAIPKNGMVITKRRVKA